MHLHLHKYEKKINNLLFHYHVISPNKVKRTRKKYGLTGLQQSEYGQRRFTGFLCCLHHSHAPYMYTDGQIMPGVFKTLLPEKRSQNNKIFL